MLFWSSTKSRCGRDCRGQPNWDKLWWRWLNNVMAYNNLKYAAHFGTFCYWIILNKLAFWINLKRNCVLIKLEAKLHIDYIWSKINKFSIFDKLYKIDFFYYFHVLKITLGIMHINNQKNHQPTTYIHHTIDTIF